LQRYAGKIRIESMNIIVSGSLAYDRIMDFPEYFSDHILPEKLHVLNISFTVNGMVEKLGGTAGNIAYALSLLGEKPIILATVGHDYHRYFESLAKKNIASDSIKIIEEEFTASAFDRVNPQESIAIIAPGNLEDMIDYPRSCKSRGIDYIFDPGQSLPMWNAQELIRSIDGSRILISNELEKTRTIITTLGEMGSRVCTPDREIDIPAAKAKEVLDPTGAGDAYRAGLIKGLTEGRGIEQCAVMGSACASFAVECYGTQEYHFSLQEFRERLDKYSG